MGNKKTLIVSAFSCCGKTTAAQTLGDKYDIVDLDSSSYSWVDAAHTVRNPFFPSNYIGAIKELIGQKDFVFVSSHQEVRDELNANNIPFVIVYPANTPVNKGIWRERLIGRGSPDSLVDKIMYKWDEMLESMELEEKAIHYVLGDSCVSDKNSMAIDSTALEHILNALK